MPYITQQDIEYHLQKDFGNTPDDVVTYLIGKAEAIVERYVGSAVEKATLTDEWYDGPGHTNLWLRDRPVISITAVEELGAALADGTGYLMYENGLLVRMAGTQIEGTWTWKRRSIKITYEAGYDPVPEDIGHVATDLAGRMFEQGAANAAIKTPGVNLERIGDYMAQYDIDRALETIGLSHENKMILNRYKKVRMA